MWETENSLVSWCPCPFEREIPHGSVTLLLVSCSASIFSGCVSWNPRHLLQLYIQQWLLAPLGLLRIPVLCFLWSKFCFQIYTCVHILFPHFSPWIWARMWLTWNQYHAAEWCVWLLRLSHKRWCSFHVMSWNTRLGALSHCVTSAPLRPTYWRSHVCAL